MGVTQHGRTHRLDLADPTLREWDCTVVWSDPADPEAGIVLDRSAFYPGGFEQRIVRFCFAKKDTTLQRALERLARL